MLSFITMFAPHFRVNKDSRFVKTFVLDGQLLPAFKKFASGKRYLKPRTINHFFCLILSSELFIEGVYIDTILLYFKLSILLVLAASLF